MTKIDVSTQVDAAGARLGLYREPDESLYDYQLRIKTATQRTFSRSKESFEDSLDYITANRTKNIFLINKPDNLADAHLSFDGIFLKINNEYFNIKKHKFLIDIKGLLETKGYIVESLNGYEDFLKSKNILQFDSNRHEINYLTPRTNLFELDSVGVSNLVDSGGNYASVQEGEFDINYANWNRTNNQEEIYLKEENDKSLILRENYTEDTISFNYKKFPLILKWSVFNYYCLNDNNFDYRIKTERRVNALDTEDTPYLLTQEGAKLIDKCNKLSNTYWGK